MMRRPSPASSSPRLCQLCELIASRPPLRSAKRPLVTLHTGGVSLALPSRTLPAWPTAARLFATSAARSRVKQTQAVQPPQSQNPTKARFSGKSTSPPNRTAKSPGDTPALAAAVDRVTKLFLAQPGIPSEDMTMTALRACWRNDLKLALDSAEQRSEASAVVDPASHLLGLDSDTKTQQQHHVDAAASEAKATPAMRVQDVVDKFSDAAYAIITHPPVVITQKVLELYVELQSRLGKPETLPQVFELFASKPRPRLASGSIKYVEPNPSKLSNAVHSAVADVALTAAIEAKNLDAAVGIVESTYATKATRRQRMLNKAFFPSVAFGGTPIAIYLLATNFSLLQNSMEPTMARNVAFAAILAYVGFTATIGGVAATTTNDQMKRVTWAPGTPLRQRWLREEERAAYDRVAVGFGFSEQTRWGEEEGEEFLLLREFLLRRGMILDAVELMPGMN
ncbi:hypothetical protein QBC39DRAFT_246673 [Podospora conica]|nr:hypothetical protein QBC39DRAFT_246673 [Schizothecium conicum]